MNKNIFIVAIAALLSATVCSLSASAQKVSKDYNVGRFTAISMQSVGNIVFTQSATCSCRMEGSSEFVERTEITVKNGTLLISTKEKYKSAKKTKNGEKINYYISAPDLTKVEIDGVGNFRAKETLKLKKVAFSLDGVGNIDVKDLHCDEVKIEVDGVGNIQANVACATLKAEVDGVGNITVSGKADKAVLKRDGVGRIYHKNLECKEVITRKD